MADERARIEIGFDGGQIMGALVQGSSLTELEQALEGGADGTLVLEADDGRYTVALSRIVYVKRFARDPRVGFGAQ
ncbi:MAG: hypothetical protein LC685_04055 [Actinobacteria bacterium]|nr:hypothetical protein [Actinomycetota bacterium]